MLPELWENPRSGVPRPVTGRLAVEPVSPRARVCILKFFSPFIFFSVVGLSPVFCPEISSLLLSTGVFDEFFWVFFLAESKCACCKTLQA